MTTKSKLVVDDWSGSSKVRLRWYFPDDDEGDTGAALGETYNEADMAKPEPKVKANDLESLEDWESWMAEKLGKELAPEKDSEGYYWESASAARGALAKINKRLKDGPDAKPDVVISHGTATAALEALEAIALSAPKTTKAAIAELKKVLGRKK